MPPVIAAKDTTLVASGPVRVLASRIQAVARPSPGSGGETTLDDHEEAARGVVELLEVAVGCGLEQLVGGSDEAMTRRRQRSHSMRAKGSG